MEYAFSHNIQKLMEYAFSHNIQKLEVVCVSENDIEFPALSLFGSSQSLKHLSLTNGSNERWSRKRSMWYKPKLKAATSILELPGLTTLYLEYVTFCFCSDDHTQPCVGLDLSKCPNLKNLTLKACETGGLDSFGICHHGLENFTLDDSLYNVKVVNVVAPQLENLTIRCYGSNRPEHVISAPNLAFLAYRGYYRPLHLNSTADGFHCLKEADIWVINPNVAGWSASTAPKCQISYT